MTKRKKNYVHVDNVQTPINFILLYRYIQHFTLCHSQSVIAQDFDKTKK